MSFRMLNSISSLPSATTPGKLAPFGPEDRLLPTGPPDPSKVEGDQDTVKEAFWKVTQEINRRIELLVALPFDKLDALRLEAETKAIGAAQG